MANDSRKRFLDFIRERIPKSCPHCALRALCQKKEHGAEGCYYRKSIQQQKEDNKE